MALLDKYSILLRWWLFFAVASLGTVALFLSGIIHKVNEVDVTKISFLIYAVFVVFTIRVGIHTFRLCREDKITNRHVAQYYKKSDIGWFVSDMLLTLVTLPQISRHTEEQNMITRNRRCVYAKKVRFRI